MNLKINQKLILVFLFVSLLAQKSWTAEFLLQANGYYSADSLTFTTSNSRTRMAGGAEAAVAIAKTGIYLGGIFNYVSDTSTDVFSSQDMGLYAQYYLDKKRYFSVVGAYFLSASGLYESGGVQRQWSGTAYLARFTIQLPLKKKWFLGPTLNYYSASYNQETANGVQRSVSFAKSYVYPSLSIGLTF